MINNYRPFDYMKEKFGCEDDKIVDLTTTLSIRYIGVDDLYLLYTPFYNFNNKVGLICNDGFRFAKYDSINGKLLNNLLDQYCEWCKSIENEILKIDLEKELSINDAVKQKKIKI